MSRRAAGHAVQGATAGRGEQGCQVQGHALGRERRPRQDAKAGFHHGVSTRRARDTREPRVADPQGLPEARHGGARPGLEGCGLTS